MLPAPTKDTPHGFRPAASGLLVPEALSRARQVWTRDESRLIDRATALLQSRGLQLQIRCAKPSCPSAKLERLQRPGGEYALECGCTTRVFQRVI